MPKRHTKTSRKNSIIVQSPFRVREVVEMTNLILRSAPPERVSKDEKPH
jgi:hypothetical protein